MRRAPAASAHAPDAGAHMTDRLSVPPSAAAPVHMPVHMPVRRPRDLRLDFFRGLAMFIILLAHTPNNAWTLWIPARFGFSDATEIFVFCSGLASALAFGSAFRDRGFGLGAARISFRVWQVYWAHIGLVLVVTALMAMFDASGQGPEGKVYMGSLPLIPWIGQFRAAIVGLMTLTWVPNYFDILPMYLVILAMVPAVMLAHRVGGRIGAALLVLGIWGVAQAGMLDLPSRPWHDDLPWFFNPFGWQLVFFTGFGFGMGWIPVPPRDRRLAWLCAAVLIVSLPFAWFKLHQGLWLPVDTALHDAVVAGRMATEVLWSKTPFGGLRWVHFLAVAYLAWLWAGPEGERLRTPLGSVRAVRGAWLAVAAVIAGLTVPYVYTQEILALFPALNAAILMVYGDGARAVLGGDLLMSDQWIGIAQIVHMVAMVALVWALLPVRARAALLGPVWMRFVETVRKVGSQSLAVFLASMVLAQIGGFVLDIVGADVWTRAGVNLTGMAALVATAYSVSWFKRQPWRVPARTATGTGTGTATGTGTGTGTAATTVAPVARAAPMAATR
ncbi:MAG: hypothetical protein ACJAVR_003042 [Paracoccaceae bacterium]|jgi:hypothetical protein